MVVRHRALLRFFEGEALSTAEPAILRLLRLPEFSVFPELQKIREELEARKAEQTADDPYGRCQIHVGPFLDRARFRAVLRRFVERVAGPRVLVVKGPAQSGKSYSSWWCRSRWRSWKPAIQPWTMRWHLQQNAPATLWQEISQAQRELG